MVREKDDRVEERERERERDRGSIRVQLFSFTGCKRERREVYESLLFLIFQM